MSGNGLTPVRERCCAGDIYTPDEIVSCPMPASGYRLVRMGATALTVWLCESHGDIWDGDYKGQHVVSLAEHSGRSQEAER